MKGLDIKNISQESPSIYSATLIKYDLLFFTTVYYYLLF